MIFEKNQIWTSKSNPEKSVKINYVDIEGYTNDEEKGLKWTIHNDKAWEEMVCKKLKFNGTIDELIKTRGSTYPYACCGYMSFKSFKNYIKKWNLELEENNE